MMKITTSDLQEQYISFGSTDGIRTRTALFERQVTFQ